SFREQVAIQVVFVPSFMAIKGPFLTHQPAGVIIDAVLLPAFVLNAGQQKAMIVVAILQLTTIGVYSTSQQLQVIAVLESGFPTLQPERQRARLLLAAPEDKARTRQDKAPMIELTYKWGPVEYTGGRNFGHMAFVRTPDGISIELLQKGEALPVQEPWASMGNVGSW